MTQEKDIFEQLQHPIWMKNSQNQVIFFNSCFKEVFHIDSSDSKDLINSLEEKEEYRLLLKSILEPQEHRVNYFIYKNKRYQYSISTYEKNNEEIFIGTILEDTAIELPENNEKLMLRTVIDNIPSLIFYKDKELRYMGINKACEKFYSEKGVYDIIGKNDLEFPMEDSFKDICYKHDQIVLNTKEPLYIEEKVFSPMENVYKTFQTIKTPVLNDEGEVVGLVGVVRDMTEYKQNEEKLTYLSYIDHLTSLYNRFYFDKKIEEHVKNELFPIGVVFGDVNGLKLINDTFGHRDGDEFLVRVAQCIKACCDQSKTAFRLGGDEFCIVMPHASKEECMIFINQINEYCAKEKYNNIEISISLGFALLEKGQDINAILSEAEDKVYKQKILDSKSIRISTLSSLKGNLHNKNIETEEHTERVVALCKKIGEAVGFSAESIDELMLAARLHDIGKIAIPDHILLKPDKLTPDEFEIMKTHSEKGYRLVLLLPELSHIARAILTHHERWDGQGYPLGLKGEEIPLISRIVAVVDAFDAMISDRIYSKAISKEDAIDELKRCAGKQFDSSIVELFCNIIDSIPLGI